MANTKTVVKKDCNHPIAYLGAHEDFGKGWICPTCRQQVKELDLSHYVVVFAAIRLDKSV